MKIMICGSMAFIKDILNVRKQLNKLGHTALIPHGTEPHLIDNKFVEKLGDNLEWSIRSYGDGDCPSFEQKDLYSKSNSSLRYSSMGSRG